MKRGQKPQFKDGQKIWTGTLQQDIQKADEHMKSCSTYNNYVTHNA